MTDTKVAIEDLMIDLANTRYSSDIFQKRLLINLQKKLFINKDKMKSLIDDMDNFTGEKGYEYLEKAESSSKEISTKLKSLETELKAIGGDISSFKPVKAEDHYYKILKNLKDTKTTWDDEFTIFKSLAKTYELP